MSYSSGRARRGFGLAGTDRKLRSTFGSKLGVSIAALSLTSAMVALLPASGSATTAADLPTSNVAAPDVPVNVQVGTGIVPLTCKVPIVGNYTVDLDVTGLAPTVVGPGQVFYAEGYGSVTLPQGLTNILSDIGVKSISGEITTADLDVTDATPATTNMAATPWVIPSTKLVNGKPTTVQLPTSGDFLAGPITAAASGRILITTGDIALTVKAEELGIIPISLNITCGAPSPPFVAGGVTIGGPTSSTPLIPAPVPPLTEPNLVPGTQYGLLTVPWSCDVPGIGTLPADVTSGGYGPTFYTPGQTGSITDVTSTLTFPAESIDALISAGASSTQLTVTDFEMMASGATPASENVFGSSPVVEPTIALTEGTPAYLGIPVSGHPMTIGPFTAAESGSTIYTYGTTSATLTLYGANGAPDGSPIAITCSAPSPQPDVFQLDIDAGTSPPVVTALSSDSGPATGGGTITVTGSDFSKATSVEFGLPSATSVSIGLSGKSLTATIPPGVAGTTVDVEVLGPGGTSSNSSADQYTYS